MAEDEAIILRCQNGDKEAYGLIVQKYMKRAYFTALGLVGSHDGAMDLSQEAFVRAFRAIDRMDSKRRFFTWYYQILRNLCLNFIRDSKRRARPFAEVSEHTLRKIQDGSDETSYRAESNEIKEIVWKGLNELNQSQREIIILKDFQELSYKEIAEVLDIPIGTVMSRLYNARQALKTKLERYL